MNLIHTLKPSKLATLSAGMAFMLACSLHLPAHAAARTSSVSEIAVGAAAAPDKPVILAQSRKKRRGGEEQGAPAGGIAGRYALLREQNKDSGCLLTLNAGGRALLGPGCKDQGLVVFDPQGWSAGRGTIILRARKGHRLTFVRKPDGIYVREPADKRPLALRKY